ncbi:MAG: hypothetical protein KDD51_07120 [Bdellovibrionales bacterium]|nr:hypothetical protein [Bdellovibrionales bacterium]
MRCNPTAFARKLLSVLLLLVFCLAFPAQAESLNRITSQPKQQQGKKKPKDKEDKVAPKERPAVQEKENLDGKTKVERGTPAKKTKVEVYYEPFYRYILHTMLGVNIVDGRSGVVGGAQLGFALGERQPWYLGPEINFSLYSPGSLIQPMLGLWYQLRIYRSPRLSVATGVLLGAAIPSNFTPVPNTTFSGFFEAVISQELNDLVSMRGQLRPGFIGSKFAFMMNLNVTFRFL